MSGLLTKLLGRIPIGWLQLSYSRMRMLAAVFGVAFANVLVFVQLGIIGAFNTSIQMSYQPLVADIIISASDANTLSDGSSVTRRYMYQSLSLPEISSAAPLYIGLLNWNLPNGNAASIQVYGVPPESLAFFKPEYEAKLKALNLQNTLLLDAKTRGLDSGTLKRITDQQQRIELNNVALAIIDTVTIGGGFGADGNIFVSDQTFFRLFPKQQAGTPSHILLSVNHGDSNQQHLDKNIQAIAKQLEQHLQAPDAQVHALKERISNDVTYQMTKRPVGVIFGFGVFIGILVGVVIVYQVLSTDVADHLKEYATFKSMGYENSFFYGVITEQAILLACIGFVPGSILAMLIYAAMTLATGLPVSMEVSRLFIVLFGTIIACMISGFIATRRLKSADPAELF